MRSFKSYDLIEKTFYFNFSLFKLDTETIKSESLAQAYLVIIKLGDEVYFKFDYHLSSHIIICKY